MLDCLTSFPIGSIFYAWTLLTGLSVRDRVTFSLPLQVRGEKESGRNGSAISPTPSLLFLEFRKGTRVRPPGRRRRVESSDRSPCTVAHNKVEVNLVQVHGSFMVKFYFTRNLVPKIWNFNTTLTGEAGDNHPLLPLTIKLKIGLS